MGPRNGHGPSLNGMLRALGVRQKSYSSLQNGAIKSIGPCSRPGTQIFNLTLLPRPNSSLI